MLKPFLSILEYNPPSSGASPAEKVGHTMSHFIKVSMRRCPKYASQFNRKSETNGKDIEQTLRKKLSNFQDGVAVSRMMQQICGAETEYIQSRDSFDEFPSLYFLFCSGLANVIVSCKINSLQQANKDKKVDSLIDWLKEYILGRMSTSSYSLLALLVVAQVCQWLVNMIHNADDPLYLPMTKVATLHGVFEAIKSENLLPWHKEASNAFELQYERLMQYTQNVIEELKKKKFTISKLDSLTPALKACTAVGLTKQQDVEFLQECRSEFVVLSSQLNDLVEVVRWLRKYGVDIEQPPMNDKVDTLNVLQIRCEDTRRDVDGFTDSEELTKDLIFFITKKSASFTNFAGELLKAGQEATVERVALIVTKTKEFLDKLRDVEKLKLSEIQPVYDVINKLNQNFEEELNILSAHNASQGPRYTKKDAEEQRKNLESALALLQYNERIPLLVDCLTKYDLCSIEREVMLDILDSLKDTSNVPLSAVREKLEGIKKQLAQLEPQQLSYFRMVNETDELIWFLLPYPLEEFNTTINFLNGDLQGDEFGLDLVNNLITARRMLEPFLLILSLKDRGSKPLSKGMTLSTLCSKVKDAISGFDISAKVDEVQKLLQHLPVIRVWFSSTTELTLDRFLPYITHLLETGYYVSRLALHPDGEEFVLCYREGRVKRNNTKDKEGEAEQRKLPPSHLQDIVRAVNIFVSKDTIDEERARDLKRFISVYKEAQRIHKFRLGLEEIGHMDYQGVETPLNKGTNDLDVEAFEEQVKLLECEWQDWKKQLEAAHAKYPRLLFLKRPQLSQVMAKLKKPKRSLPRDLLPFLWVCFPDQSGWDESIGLEVAWKKAFSSNLPKLLELLSSAAPKTSAFYLNALGSLIKVIEDELGILPSTPQHRPPKVVAAFNFTPWDMLRLHIAIYHNPLHPSQIFECSPKTMVEELDRFLAVLSAFGDLEFVLVHANLLPVEARERLLKWSSALFLEHEHVQGCGALRIIFTEPTGLEFFSFLNVEKYDSKSIVSARDMATSIPSFTPTAIQKRCQISQLLCWKGPPCSGKSFDITNQLQDLEKRKQINHSLCISITEGFTPATFIEKYRAIARGSSSNVRLGVHFNISGYADFAMVAQFFELFLYWGIFSDDATGDVEHIINVDKWYLFLELGTSPANDSWGSSESASSADTVDKILDMLPVIKHAGSFITQPRCPFQADADAAIVCGFFFLNRGGKLVGSLKSVLQAVNSIGEQVQTNEVLAKQLDLVFEELQRKRIRLPVQPLHRRSFVSLLAERCRWLTGYLQRKHHTEQSGFDSAFDKSQASQLFEQFLLEAGKLCEEDFKHNCMTAPPLLSSRGPAGSDDFSFISFSKTAQLPLLANASIVSLQEALSKPALLRISLAPGLGLSDTSKMWNIIKQQRYVLTPDFALKLLILNERRKVGLNVVLSGDTGVGKTELLNLYSLAINSDSSLVADLLYLLRMFIKDHLLQITGQGLVHKNFAQYLKGPLELQDEGLMLKGVILTICKQIVPVPASPRRGGAVAQKGDAQADVEQKPYFARVAARLVRFMKSVLEGYRLISTNDTKFLKLVLTRTQPEDLKEDDERLVVVKDARDLEQLINEYLNCKYEQLFHRILMHQNITVRDFKERVKKIAAAANRVGKLSPGASVVAFVDEFNTASVMGMVKEVFMDHTLDGVPLPKNIFWVAAMNPSDTPKEKGNKSRKEKRKNDFNFTGIKSMEKTFAVRPPPPSMQEIILDFNALDHSQEEVFLRVLFDIRPDLGSESEREMLKQFILMGQEFVRSARIYRVHVSIRDILRVVNLYHYLRTERRLPHPR